MAVIVDPRAAEPEALLLQRVARGDEQAFALLARMIARPALGLAVRTLGDVGAAEDAVQEALARLWREAGRYDPERGGFGAFWRRMLLNVALDGRRRLRPVASIDDAIDRADSAAGPESLAVAADLARRVQKAADGLPARQRAALSLFHGDGLTMAEVADALETTEKAVEGLLHRGRAALKAQLAADGVTDDR